MTMTTATTESTILSEADRLALERCIALALEEDQGLREQVTWMLENNNWLEVAQYCSYHLQYRALHLSPWESPPCWIDPEGCDVQPRDAHGRQLLKRMTKLGVSRFAPDPVGALAIAQALRKATKP
jgi:hypothetical protein